ncbi:MAG: substrate-binding domain-containing protein [Treponema sp.]|nr:substrate-binding domain-containing protein [Treponema sp.]
MRIGLVLNSLDEEYQISLYRGIKQRTAELGIQIICIQEGNTAFLSDAFIGCFPRKDYFNLDGIILLTSVVADNCTLNTKQDIQRIWGLLPVISVGQKIEGVPSLLIQTDDSMKDLVGHLVKEHKYRNFIYIGGAQKHQDAINREQIFTELIQKYQKEYPEINYTIKHGSFTEQSAVRAMDSYIKENPGSHPDVVVCANDNMAIGVYKYLNLTQKNDELKNIAVTGFDDIPQGQFTIPPLTTVHQPLDKLGHEAVNLIYRLVQGEAVPLEESVGSHVIYRESCGCQRKENNLEAMRESFAKMQSSYVVSEQMLNITSHIGRDLNNDNDEADLVSIIDYNIAMLGIDNFCILMFPSKLRQDHPLSDNILYVRPVYVKFHGQRITSFPYDDEGNLTLGQFYDFLCPSIEGQSAGTPLVFKYLNVGNDYIGCILYDAPETSLPYIILISIDIALTMNRIEANEERARYAVYLESEVNKRTSQLIEEQSRRMEVEAEVLKISEIERQRFSNDLHDDICQRLAGISMLCRSYSSTPKPVEKAQMAELAGLVNDTLHRTRQYAHNSYPVDLETLGLDASLSNLCNSFEQQSDIACRYEWSIPEAVVFDKTQKLNIFRIIQEALHNVMKHSKAKNVNVTCRLDDNFVIVTICDDGIGISEEKKNTFGIGLNSMQYRANQIGAEFSIKVPEGQTNGTLIEIKMGLR